MEMTDATLAFAALSQPNRLAVLRLLVRMGRDGMAAGEIAKALDAKPNTMSVNLAILQRAGLVTSEREGRSIRYCADLVTLGALLSFLMEDCCGGQPEQCRPLIDELICNC